MSDYKLEFIEFLVQERALQFGEFTLKSGRVSPYFFNTASFNKGASIARLGYFYASALRDFSPDCTLIFGPAYKGIPLCIATVSALSNQYNQNLGYFFDRKEPKTHGDKGILVGQAPSDSDNIVMVDDVITDGLTKRESIKLLQQLSKATISGVIVAVDRMETNAVGQDTFTEFQKDTGVPVQAIVTIEEICDYLLEREINGSVYLTREVNNRIEAYLQTFRVRKSNMSIQ